MDVVPRLVLAVARSKESFDRLDRCIEPARAASVFAYPTTLLARGQHGIGRSVEGCRRRPVVAEGIGDHALSINSRVWVVRRSACRHVSPEVGREFAETPPHGRSDVAEMAHLAGSVAEQEVGSPLTETPCAEVARVQALGSNAVFDASEGFVDDAPAALIPDPPDHLHLVVSSRRRVVAEHADGLVERAHGIQRLATKGDVGADQPFPAQQVATRALEVDRGQVTQERSVNPVGFDTVE